MLITLRMNRYLVALCVAVLLGCEPVSPLIATSSPQADQQNPPVSSLRDFSTVPPAPTSQFTSQPGCQSLVEGAIATQHTVVADVHFARHQIEVRQMIRYTNLTGETLQDIVLNVEPNRTAGAFALESLMLAGVDAAYILDGRRLRVDLPEGLAPDCDLRLTLTFTIDVPLIGEGVTARRGYFGRTPRQMNLGHWLPVVAVRQGGAWITRDPYLIGEQEVLDLADWDVTISLVDAPADLVIAAPGSVTALNGALWRFQLLHARDFSFSLGLGYNVITTTTVGGITVELYTFDDAVITTAAGVQVDSAAHALDVAARSVEMYASLFGPYPYERLLVIQGDFPDGMEFTGLVFVGGGWFVNYPGRPASYLTLITVHEVSHQWWYARVGSDPALTPWLDEALATYSEYIFIEEYYPDLRDWWWQFRVENFSPTGYVDSSVYEFSTVRDYINAVYLRGVLMLHQLRTDLGTEVFFDLLNSYAEAADGQIAAPDLFWSLLTPEQFFRTESTRRTFLRQPVSIPESDD